MQALSLERDVLPKLEVGVRLPCPALNPCLPIAACSHLAAGLILLAGSAGAACLAFPSAPAPGHTPPLPCPLCKPTRLCPPALPCPAPPQLLEALSPGLGWKVFRRYPEEFASPDALECWRVLAAFLFTTVGIPPEQVRRHRRRRRRSGG